MGVRALIPKKSHIFVKHLLSSFGPMSPSTKFERSYGTIQLLRNKVAKCVDVVSRREWHKGSF